MKKNACEKNMKRYRNHGKNKQNAHEKYSFFDAQLVSIKFTMLRKVAETTSFIMVSEQPF